MVLFDSYVDLLDGKTNKSATTPSKPSIGSVRIMPVGFKKKDATGPKQTSYEHPISIIPVTHSTGP